MIPMAYGTAAAATNPWDFTRITTDLWIDTADQSTIFDSVTGFTLPAADAPVLRIGDKSGNGRDLKQPTSGNAGIRKMGEVNNLDVVRLDGVNDGYSLDTDLALTSHTILMAFKPAATITDASAGQCLLSGGTAGASTAEMILFTGGVTGNIPAERLSHLIVQASQVYGYAKSDANISGANQFSLVWNNGTQVFSGAFNGNTDFATTSSAAVNPQRSDTSDLGDSITRPMLRST